MVSYIITFIFEYTACNFVSEKAWNKKVEEDVYSLTGGPTVSLVRVAGLAFRAFCEYSYKLSGLLLIENPRRKEKDS